MPSRSSKLLFLARPFIVVFLFFFNDPATTEIYTLSLHDALPIKTKDAERIDVWPSRLALGEPMPTIPLSLDDGLLDRKSTRLNSSHVKNSYAVFCLKKKKHTYRRPSRHRRSQHRLRGAPPCL